MLRRTTVAARLFMLALLASIAAWAAMVRNESIPAQAAMISNEQNLKWVSLRDLTSAQFSAAFAKYKDAGYLMIDVDAYPHGSGLPVFNDSKQAARTHLARQEA